MMLIEDFEEDEKIDDVGTNATNEDVLVTL